MSCEGLIPRIDPLPFTAIRSLQLRILPAAFRDTTKKWPPLQWRSFEQFELNNVRNKLIMRVAAVIKNNKLYKVNVAA